MRDDDDLKVVKSVSVGFIVVVVLCLLMSFFKKSVQLYSEESDNYVKIRYKKACINNREFIIHGRGITINFDADGKPIVCSNKKEKLERNN